MNFLIHQSRQFIVVLFFMYRENKFLLECSSFSGKKFLCNILVHNMFTIMFYIELFALRIIVRESVDNVRNEKDSITAQNIFSGLILASPASKSHAKIP